MRNQVLVMILLYIFLFKYCRVVMMGLEARQGTQVNDYFLQLLPSYDCSLVTFLFTYAALATFVLSAISFPKIFTVWLQAYCLLIVMRTIAIYLVPLEPPIGMILLEDPVTILFMSRPGGGYIVKDLFFSGHVSAIVLFYLVSKNLWVKKILLWIALIVSALLLIQHVHYTIDIIAAPFFAFVAYKSSLFLNKIIHQEADEEEASVVTVQN